MKLDSLPLRAIAIVAFLGVLTSACLLWAADDSKKAADPFAGAFFPPELVLLAHDQIALTREQQTAVVDQVEKTHLKFTELQAQLKRETAALATIAEQDRVDERALVAQLDKLLDVEREAKHLQIGSVVAVKNLLTPSSRNNFGGSRRMDPRS
jgi:Spy/CpxP family protein refolding chaperone